MDIPIRDLNLLGPDFDVRDPVFFKKRCHLFLVLGLHEKDPGDNVVVGDAGIAIFFMEHPPELVLCRSGLREAVEFAVDRLNVAFALLAAADEEDESCCFREIL